MNGPNAANESEAPRDNLDPVLLDRLVDGELAETERRKLLLSLDHQPSGWRQCALAFLEAQSWGDLLAAATGKPAAAAVETAAVEPAPKPSAESGPAEPASMIVPSSTARRRGSPSRWLWVAEMAASFLVAFSLGLMLRGGLRTTTAQPSSRLGATAIGTVGNGETRTVEGIAQGSDGQIIVPDDVRRAIERSGGQIRQVRKYFPVELPDGRRGLVPVDQFEVVPVDNRGMQ